MVAGLSDHGRRAVVGFMGAGKSTAARAFAAASGGIAVDADAEIEAPRRQADLRDLRRRRRGRIPRRRGTRDARAAGRRQPPGPGRRRSRFVALGGGALASDSIRGALREHLVIWVDVDASTAWARCEHSGRPLASDRATFERLHAEREPIYARAADVVVPQRLGEGPRAVLDALEGMPAGVRMLWATSASGEYPAYIGPGLLGGDSDRPRAFWPATIEGRRFLVCDGHSGRLYGDRIAPLDGRVAIMPGEQSKTIAHAEIVWSELIRAGMTRADVVIALGGGVVGDLAGFCAATYQRGVRFVQVPTTVVAQVDSAYGGKTGVDLTEAKNYVGAYHQPRAVIADTDALATLPAQELAAGYAEVVKTALLAGGWLWERVRDGAEPDRPRGDLRLRALQAPGRRRRRARRRPAPDAQPRPHRRPRDRDRHRLRQLPPRRGGRARAARGAAAVGRRRPARRGRRAVRAKGLPTTMQGVDPDAVVVATARDKKRVGEGPVPFVLLSEPGAARTGCTVAPRELITAVRELAR